MFLTSIQREAKKKKEKKYCGQKRTFQIPVNLQKEMYQNQKDVKTSLPPLLFLLVAHWESKEEGFWGGLGGGRLV